MLWGRHDVRNLVASSRRAMRSRHAGTQLSAQGAVLHLCFRPCRKPHSPVKLCKVGHHSANGVVLWSGKGEMARRLCVAEAGPE